MFIFNPLLFLHVWRCLKSAWLSIYRFLPSTALVGKCLKYIHARIWSKMLSPHPLLKTIIHFFFKNLINAYSNYGKEKWKCPPVPILIWELIEKLSNRKNSAKTLEFTFTLKFLQCIYKIVIAYICICRFLERCVCSQDILYSCINVF